MGLSQVLNCVDKGPAKATKNKCAYHIGRSWCWTIEKNIGSVFHVLAGVGHRLKQFPMQCFVASLMIDLGCIRNKKKQTENVTNTNWRQTMAMMPQNRQNDAYPCSRLWSWRACSGYRRIRAMTAADFAYKCRTAEAHPRRLSVEWAAALIPSGNGCPV